MFDYQNNSRAYTQHCLPIDSYKFSFLFFTL